MHPLVLLTKCLSHCECFFYLSLPIIATMIVYFVLPIQWTICMIDGWWLLLLCFGFPIFGFAWLFCIYGSMIDIFTLLHLPFALFTGIFSLMLVQLRLMQGHWYLAQENFNWLQTVFWWLFTCFIPKHSPHILMFGFSIPMIDMHQPIHDHYLTLFQCYQTMFHCHKPLFELHMSIHACSIPMFGLHIPMFDWFIPLHGLHLFMQPFHQPLFDCNGWLFDLFIPMQPVFSNFLVVDFGFFNPKGLLGQSRRLMNWAMVCGDVYHGGKMGVSIITTKTLLMTKKKIPLLYIA